MKCRNTKFNRLSIFLLSFYVTTAFAQEAKTTLNAPEKLDILLSQKINIDREIAEKKLFTIQVYYGDFEPTTALLEEFKELYPTLPVRLIFETPNYKIRTGNFSTEREALEMLERIKRRFKAAFVLKP